MKLNLIGACLVSVTLLGTGVVWGDSDTDHSSPKHFIKHSVITTKVKSRLAAEHLTTLARIHVDTDENGVVWLTGTAHKQEVIDKAVDIARHTENVTDVHNDIHLKEAQ